MNINKLNIGQQRVLFNSLKGQYESLRPMTGSEESTMWDLLGALWKANGGKFGLGMKIKTK